MALSTLGTNDAISVATKVDNTRLRGYRMIKSIFHFGVTGKTATEGPIIVGVAINMSAGDIEKAMEADPQSPSEDDARGIGGFIKTLFMLDNPATVWPVGFNGMIEVSYGKNGWSCPQGQAVTVFAYNTASTLSTGTIIQWVAEHFGVWLRD